MGKNNKKNKRIAKASAKAAEEQAHLQQITDLKQSIANREKWDFAPTKTHYQAANDLIKTWGDHPLGCSVDWLVPNSKTKEDALHAKMVASREAALATGGIGWWANSQSVPDDINEMLTQIGWVGEPAIKITSTQGDMTTSRCWFNSWALAEIMGCDFVAGYEVKFDAQGWLRMGSHGVVMGNDGVLYDPTHTGGVEDKQKWFIPSAEKTAWFNHVINTHTHIPPHNAIIIATKFFEGYCDSSNGEDVTNNHDRQISSRDSSDASHYTTFHAQAAITAQIGDVCSFNEVARFLHTILPFFYTKVHTTDGDFIAGMECDPTTGTRTWNIPQRWRGQNGYFNKMD